MHFSLFLRSKKPPIKYKKIKKPDFQTIITSITKETDLDISNLFHVTWFTFFQAAGSTLVALIIGLPAAFFCGRRRFFGKRVLLSLSAVPFCVPSLIIALGYVTFLGMNGGLNKFLMAVFGLQKPPVQILYSFAGLLIAQGFYNFPLVMKNVSQAWEQLPSEQTESARLLGANEFRIFRTVTIHQLIPSIASSSLLVFIYCFLSFVLVLLFGGIGNSTLEVEIYKAARATLDFKTAGILAFFETAFLCIITVLYCLVEQKNTKSKGLKSKNINIQIKLAGAEYKILEICIFVIMMVLIVVFFLAPLGGIVYNAFTSPKTGGKFTLSSFNRIIKMKSFLPSIITTIKTAFFTGSFCAIFGFLYAVLMRFMEGKTKKRTAVFLQVLPILPMCISSVVVGVIITIIVRDGNIFWLIAAQTFLSWPLAFKVIFPQLQKISNSTIDAAKLISKNNIQIVWRIFFPICKSSILSAFGFCFAISAGDTTLPLVLAIPKFNTLSLFTYRLAGAYRFNEACAAGVLLAILCVGFFSFTGNNAKTKEK